MQTEKTTNIMDACHQWMTRPEDQRFQTLEALRDSVKGRAIRSREDNVDSSEIVADMNPEGLLVINGKLQPSQPTHWSFGQLAAGIKAPANYLRTLPPDLALQNIRHGISSTQTRDQWKFMTIEEETGPNTLQAITSQRYGRIWDFQCVEAVERIVERTGGKFRNPMAYATGGRFGGSLAPSGLYASDHDVFMFMIDGGDLLDAGDRAQLHRGFIVQNSETGAATFSLQTFLFNTCCGNNIIWGARNIDKLIIRHTSGGPTRFDNEAAATLTAYAEESGAGMIANVKRAQDFLLPTPDKDKTLVETLRSWRPVINAKLSGKEVEQAITFAKSEEGKCASLWDFTQGLTAYARGFAWIDSKLELEKKAGKLLQMVEDQSRAPVTIAV